MPDRLADLVPRYLPREPVCAASGAPFLYVQGMMKTPEEIIGLNRADWKIRRR